MCVLCWHARLSASCLRTFLLTCVASLYQLKICLKFNRDSDLSKFVLADFFKKMDPLIFFKVDRLIWPKGYDFLQPKWCLLNWAQVVLEEPYGRRMQKRNRVPIVPPRLIRGMWESAAIKPMPGPALLHTGGISVFRLMLNVFCFRIQFFPIENGLPIKRLGNILNRFWSGKFSPLLTGFLSPQIFYV
jgi:hypothetical protein